ncbi:MAG: endolytic transglycosylase MltG [Bacteroidia bacterium]|nr:endolytic transglycosylase MltG [Bacteroidia bacterium]
MKRKYLLWGIIGAIALCVLFVYPLYQRVFSPMVHTSDGHEAEFFVPTGSDYKVVGDRLLENGLIDDLAAFHWVASKMNYPNTVRPGRFMLQDGMNARELVTLLRSGKQAPVKYTFVKFRTKDQLAETTAEKLELSKEDLLELLNDREFLNRYNGLTPETVLAVFIPNTYEFYWNVTPEDFFAKIFEYYKRFWNDERNAKRENLRLSRLEVMALASIVEEETNKNDEKARVAGVYLNRVRKGWPLEADPTVKYAVGDFTLRRILYEHLQIDSPYNTYLYAGIPPGPICTPSVPSIEAVLNGEKHDYMFFCAKTDGSGYHHFSRTLSEHNAYAAEYHRMLNQQKIR